MVDKREVDIGKLVNEWKEEKGGLNDSACILFPYLDKLTDENVREFYKSIEDRGYAGQKFETVKDVRDLNETYRIITRCVREEFISF